MNRMNMFQTAFGSVRIYLIIFLQQIILQIIFHCKYNMQRFYKIVSVEKHQIVPTICNLRIWTAANIKPNCICKIFSVYQQRNKIHSTFCFDNATVFIAANNKLALSLRFSFESNFIRFANHKSICQIHQPIQNKIGSAFHCLKF